MTEWRERAACAGLDVEIFFAPEGHRTIPFDTDPAMAVLRPLPRPGRVPRGCPRRR